jgi:hypothetical protein
MPEWYGFLCTFMQSCHAQTKEAPDELGGAPVVESIPQRVALSPGTQVCVDMCHSFVLTHRPFNDVLNQLEIAHCKFELNTCPEIPSAQEVLTGE